MKEISKSNRHKNIHQGKTLTLVINLQQPSQGMEDLILFIGMGSQLILLYVT